MKKVAVIILITLICFSGCMQNVERPLTNQPQTGITLTKEELKTHLVYSFAIAWQEGYKIGYQKALEDSKEVNKRE